VSSWESIDKMTLTPKSIAHFQPLPIEKRAHDRALLLAWELAQLQGKVIDGVLMMRPDQPSPFGGLASGLRRVAARLEVCDTDKQPEFKEYAPGELNWTDAQKNALTILFVYVKEYIVPEGIDTSEILKIINKAAECEKLFFPESKSKTTT
jgi:hypothetical protein